MTSPAGHAPGPSAPDFELDAAAGTVARQAAARGLCPECLGRVFGRRGHGLTNPERAGRLAERFGVAACEPGACTLCGGLFSRLDQWADRVVKAGQEYDWERFACGSRWDPELLAREESLWAAVGSTEGESARGAFNRELGKLVAARTGADGRPDEPEITFLADLPVGRVELTVMPLYLVGRYRKLDRSLPQTRWPCRRCRGLGCTHCSGTGKTYPTSVEELIADPFVRATDSAGTRFHGMGREDIDARMLGDGRPFVLELLRPHRRHLDLSGRLVELEQSAGGRVEVVDLRAGTAQDVVQVKQGRPDKSYRVGVVGEVAEAKVNEALELVRGRAIAQRTPARVAHRRSDRVRTRRIVEARLVDASAGRFTLELRAEAGTYIKEWVEGDGGRTEPSLAGLLSAPLRVEFLDVTAIHDREG